MIQSVQVLVVGAGIGGLTCAWRLRKAQIDVAVLEAQSTTGGMLKTSTESGFRVDSGANSTVLNASLAQMVEALGIEDQMIEVDPRAENRYICLRQKLWPVPLTPKALLRSSMLSTPAKLRLLLEPIIPLKQQEQSIHDFCVARLGQTFTNTFVDPFVSGIWAGDIHKLSMQACFPKLMQDLQKSGSLLKVLMNKSRQSKNQTSKPSSKKGSVSFKQGMQFLPDTLNDQLKDCIHLNTDAVQITQNAGEWTVETAQQSWTAQHLVLAMPAHQIAKCLPHWAYGQRFAEVASSPVVSMALGYKRSDIGHLLDGFGVLFPRSEGLKTLGVLFSSTMFPTCCPSDRVLLTVFLGGSHHPELVEFSDEDLLALVRQELDPILQIKEAPMFQKIMRWHMGIPQYELGHNAKMAAVMADLTKQYSGLEICSNGHDGVSVSDRIQAGMSVADRLIQSIKS